MTSTTLPANHIEPGNARNTGAQFVFFHGSQRTIVGVSALFFAVSAMVTVLCCNSMSAMGEMRMQGGWTMSMAWMRMPGQSWWAAMVSFVGMWALMMVAMMMPSHVPMLLCHRQAVVVAGTRHARPADRTREHGLFLSVDGGRNRDLSNGCRTRCVGDAIVGAGAC